MDSFVAFGLTSLFGYLLGKILRMWWFAGLIVGLCLLPALHRILTTPAEWFTITAALLYGMIFGAFRRELWPMAVNSFYWLRNRWEVRSWERRQERRESAAESSGDQRPERRHYEPPSEPEPSATPAAGFWKRWAWQIAAKSARGWLRPGQTLRDEVRDARRETVRLREELELQRRQQAAQRSRSEASVAAEEARLRQERQAFEEERRRQAAASSAPRDPYAVLGVRREASLEKIRRVYRALAKAYHEDVASGVAVEGRMAELNQAMEEIERSRPKS
jgi:hypothetical protein